MGKSNNFADLQIETVLIFYNLKLPIYLCGNESKKVQDLKCNRAQKNASFQTQTLHIFYLDERNRHWMPAAAAYN